MSSRRSSLFSTGAPPPYSQVGTAATSVRSSPSSSQFKDDDIIQGPRQVYTSPRRYSEKVKLKSNKLSKLKGLDPIVEKVGPIPQYVADVESGQTPSPQPKFVVGDICSGNVFVCCTGRRSGWCVVGLFGIIVLTAIAIALGIILPHNLKSHHSAVPANATVVLTVTSVLHATSIQTVTATMTSSTSSSKPSPTLSTGPEQYLGGFDAVTTGSYTYMYYTDQEGYLKALINTYGSWAEARPFAIASDVRPGSPVSASYFNGNIYVYFVDVNYTIRGLYTRSGSTWYIDPIGSLQLQTSGAMFVRSCVAADAGSYGYVTNATFFVYYQDQQGVIHKYGYDNSLALQWQKMNDFPSLSPAQEVECQFAAGVETLWTTNNLSQLTSWYRSNASDWEWKKGFTSTETTFWASSILSLSDSSTNRSHIVFQDANNRVRQYDFNRFGEDQALSTVTALGVVTPGTRLSTWANSGYCGIGVNIYYQRDNTSDLYYTSFRDRNSYSTYVTQDVLMPIVRTYGKNVSRKAAGKPQSNAKSIVKKVFTAIGVILLVIFLCGCCAACS